MRITQAHSNRKAKSGLKIIVRGAGCRVGVQDASHGTGAESDAVSTVVNATAASTNGSCAEAW